MKKRLRNLILLLLILNSYSLFPIHGTDRTASVTEREAPAQSPFCGTDSREKPAFTLLPVCFRTEAAEGAEGTVFEPTAFSYSGGSGKMRISCPTVVVDEEGARAELIFQSEHVISVRVGDVSYDTIPEGKTSRTPLDEDCEVAALTTAMSEPHEIVYTIRISVSDEPDGADPDPAAAPDVDDTVETNAGKAAETDADHAVGTNAGKAAETDADHAVETNAGKAAETNDDHAAETENGDEDGKRSGEDLVPAFAGLTFDEKLVPDYAEGFVIYYDRSGCRLIDVFQEGRYLVLPSGLERPEDLPEDVTVIRLCPECVYLSNSAAMSLFDAMDAVDAVRLCSLTADNWYLDAPKEAMQAGKLQFAGKYSEPDYELLVESGCDLAIENTMIYHAPEVKEMLEELGIPVFVDRSSYEPHPLGRAEWIRVYAAMLGRDAEADSFFRKQEALAEEVGHRDNSGKTVAVFSVNTNGSIVIRKRDDYIPNMLRMAGGKYAFDELPGAEGSGSMNLSLEEFYALAGDADCLLYNAAIEYAPESIEALTAINPLFAEFKAVREGQVWTTQKSLYQSMGSTAEIIMDFSRMLDGSAGEETGYVTKLAGS